jgi:exonuclease VII small subunit
MQPTIKALENLYQQIPRRHNDENIVTIENCLTQFEDILLELEANSKPMEKAIGNYFDTAEEIKTVLKKSKDKKVSKKTKDDFFDEASGLFKDTIEELIVLCKEITGS